MSRVMPLKLLSSFRRANFFYFSLGCVVALTIISIPKWLMIEGSCSAQKRFLSNKKLAVVFGDSITQHGFNTEDDGWIASLSHFWSRKVDVVNRGFSGYNSRWGLSIIKQVVIPLHPQFVVIFFGANDAVVAEGATFVPLDEFGENISKMVLAVRKALPLCIVVIITPPPIGELQLEVANVLKGKKIALDRSNDRTRTYAEACVSIGSKLGVPVLDAWASLSGPLDSRVQFLSDGLHLNEAGNTRLYESFKALLGQHLPQWMPDRLPVHMVEWRQLADSQGHRYT